MTATVHSLPACDTLTPEQALQCALTDAQEGEIQDVLIVAFKPDGEFYVRSSRMTRKDALWLATRAQQHALDG